MKVEIKKEQEEVQPDPIDETEEGKNIESAPNQEADRLRQLELENAELRGKTSALQSLSRPADNSSQQNQWKTIVLNDMNSLSDDDFRAKYKYEKYQATAAILEQDQKTSEAKNRQELAELRAENRMSAKYGKNFYEVKADVDEMVSQASIEVRQDPEKLAKFMEKAYLAAAKDKKPEVALVKGEQKPKGDAMNRRIVSNFEKPTPTPQGGSHNDSKSDELPEEYRSLGRAFKITSEKERQELMKDDFVPMDLGGGLVFRDSSKGVEKVA